MIIYIINSVPFNISCVGCKLYLYLEKTLSYTKHVKKFKPAKNNEIEVLLELSSHELYIKIYSQEEFQGIIDTC